AQGRFRTGRLSPWRRRDDVRDAGSRARVVQEIAARGPDHRRDAWRPDRGFVGNAPPVARGRVAGPDPPMRRVRSDRTHESRLRPTISWPESFSSSGELAAVRAA